jgi:hypothetical protein
MILSIPQRVTLIKEVTRRLVSEDWAFIDLCLRSFSLPTSDQWNGSPEDYVVRSLERANDDTLLELAWSAPRKLRRNEVESIA